MQRFDRRLPDRTDVQLLTWGFTGLCSAMPDLRRASPLLLSLVGRVPHANSPLPHPAGLRRPQPLQRREGPPCGSRTGLDHHPVKAHHASAAGQPDGREPVPGVLHVLGTVANSSICRWTAKRVRMRVQARSLEGIAPYARCSLGQRASSSTDVRTRQGYRTAC